MIVPSIPALPSALPALPLQTAGLLPLDATAADREAPRLGRGCQHGARRRSSDPAAAEGRRRHPETHRPVPGRHDWRHPSDGHSACRPQHHRGGGSVGPGRGDRPGRSPAARTTDARRPYIGSIPGRIIPALKQAGSMNSVFMLDEIDKVGRLPRRPGSRAAQGPRPCTEPHVPRPLPRGCGRSLARALHRHGQAARHHPPRAR